MNDAWIYSEESDASSLTARMLAELGFSPRRVSVNGHLRPDGVDAGRVRQPEVAVVISGMLAEGIDSAELCRRLSEDEELCDVPVVVAVEAEELEAERVLDGHELLIWPGTIGELRARIARARQRVHGVEDGDIVRIGSLELNLATYQVRIGEEPIDFTYMEYELLKFLATHPNRVFTREALLSRVWGYDYYGGTRTVDVHVRRLRAKLGSEHAGRIKTVRSVGYQFEA